MIMRVRMATLLTDNDGSYGKQKNGAYSIMN